MRRREECVELCFCFVQATHCHQHGHRWGSSSYNKPAPRVVLHTDKNLEEGERREGGRPSRVLDKLKHLSSPPW